MKPSGTHERPTRSASLSRPKKEDISTEAEAKPRLCQVRSGTDSPCARPASVEILGVPFCERCAQKQQTYFAIGEGTRTPRGGGPRRMLAWHATRVLPSATPAGPSRRPRVTATVIGKALVLLMAVSALVLASAACGGTQPPLGDSAAEQRTVVRTPDPQEPEKVAVVDGAVARAGDAKARAGDGAVARAGDARASTRDAVASSEGKTERDDGGEDRPRKVTLKVTGDPGTAFSGLCSVGGREEAIEGRVPERYAYEPGGSKLECEIRKKTGGALEVVVTGEGIHSVQRSNAQGGTVRFALSGDSVSSSTSSVSQNQTSESSHRSLSDDSP